MDGGAGQSQQEGDPVDSNPLILHHPGGTGAVRTCPGARAVPHSRTAVFSGSTFCARRLRRRTHWPPVFPTCPRAAAVHARACSVWRAGFSDAHPKVSLLGVVLLTSTGPGEAFNPFSSVAVTNVVRLDSWTAVSTRQRNPVFNTSRGMFPVNDRGAQ